MSVYIKGMEMPKSCFRCEFCTKTDPDNLMCIISQKTFEDRFFHIEHRETSCPLVTVPPHGRLGDLDEFAKRMKNLVKKAENDGFDLGAAWYSAFVRHIELAPTIIPAKEGTECAGNQ